MITIPPVVLHADYHFELIEMEVTAYTTSYEDCGKIDGITASGTNARYGVIASPPEIDFGTEIIIGDSKFVVEDRGGAIVKKDDVYSIDMWLPTSEECEQFGRQRTKGWIIVREGD